MKRWPVVLGALLVAGCSSSTAGTGSGSTAPSTTPPTTAPVTSSAPTTAAPPTSATTAATHVLDLTFVGTNDGWALVSGPKLYRTTDGTHWHALGSSGLGAGVDHLRFADDQVGYAFGHTALYLTTDGGRTWHKQSGGADALETLNGNVIRVYNACLPGCPYQVQTAALGSSAWHKTAGLAGVDMTSGAELARAGSYSYLVVFGHTAGGAQHATSALWVSSDNGAHWTNRGESCPQVSGEVDTTRITTAADGSITALCTPRQQSQGWQFVTTSPAGGMHFTPGAEKALGAAQVSALAAASANTVLVSSDLTYRSTDGGRHFAKTAVGPASWLGFESTTVGRAVTGDRTVWTTRDAGQTWTSVLL